MAIRLINAFAVIAVLLAAFGLHGIIAYGVRQRTQEIGVRTRSVRRPAACSR